MVRGATFSSQAMSNAPGPAEASQAANERVRDKNPSPPTVLGAVEHMNLQKTGSSEDPAGEPENMGSFTEKRYSAEQQKRLGIDAKGNRVAEDAEDSALKQAAAGVDNFSASEKEAEEAEAEAATVVGEATVTAAEEAEAEAVAEAPAVAIPAPERRSYCYLELAVDGRPVGHLDSNPTCYRLQP